MALPLIPIAAAAAVGGGTGFVVAGGMNSLAKTAGYAVLLAVLVILAKVYLL